jgi:hypothetical protein
VKRVFIEALPAACHPHRHGDHGHKWIHLRRGREALLADRFQPKRESAPCSDSHRQFFELHPADAMLISSWLKFSEATRFAGFPSAPYGFPRSAIGLACKQETVLRENDPTLRSGAVPPPEHLGEC